MNYYEPGFLAGVIKKTLPPKLFFRNHYFNQIVQSPTDNISFEQYTDGRRLAPFANYASRSSSTSREAYNASTYHLPLIAPDRTISPDTLAQKLLGESPFNSGLSPEDRAAEIAARDLEELTSQIYRRQEFMCAQLKLDGKIIIEGKGIYDEIDYRFSNYEITASADKWTNNYDIVSKLNEKAQVLRRAGVNPDVIIMGLNAADAFIQNKNIQKLLDLRNVDAGNIKPEELDDGISYVGRIAIPGLIANVFMYDDYYVDESGSSMHVFDPDSVILQSSRENNYMVYGAVTYINDDNEYSSVMADYVPYVAVDREHATKKLIVASRPLPVPADIASWFTLKNVV